MQRLSATADGREGLQGDAHHVVLGLLGGQGRAAGLGVEAEHLRLRIGGAEAVAHDLCPEAPRRPEFGHLLEEVVVSVEEEGEALAEAVGREPRLDRRLAVGDSVREREGEFLDGVGAGLANVVAGDRDRVEAGQPSLAVGEQIGRDPHRRPRREDVVPARYVLLEDVVLDGAAQFLGRHALLLGDQLVEEKEKRRRRVDRHRGRDLVERYLREEQPHVAERVDGDAGAPDLALSERMVGVVTELSGQIERDREPRLALLEQVTEARVRLLGRAEAGVLANRPGSATVHGCVRAAREGIDARRLGLEPGHVLARIDGLDLDPRLGLARFVCRRHGQNRTRPATARGGQQPPRSSRLLPELIAYDGLRLSQKKAPADNVRISSLTRGTRGSAAGKPG